MEMVVDYLMIRNSRRKAIEYEEKKMKDKDFQKMRETYRKRLKERLEDTWRSQ